MALVGPGTWLWWRQRRFYREACDQTFTETRPALPSRQRVSTRFRGHLFDVCRDGAAHLGIARHKWMSCYQVNRAFALGGDELLTTRVGTGATSVAG